MYEPEHSFSILDTVFPLLMTWKQASEFVGMLLLKILHPVFIEKRADNSQRKSPMR